MATLDCRRDSDSGATETITAGFGTLTATARQYWAGRIPAGTGGSGEIVVVDPGNNRAVVQTLATKGAGRGVHHCHNQNTVGIAILGASSQSAHNSGTCQPPPASTGLAASPLVAMVPVRW